MDFGAQANVVIECRRRAEWNDRRVYSVGRVNRGSWEMSKESRSSLVVVSQERERAAQPTDGSARLDARGVPGDATSKDWTRDSFIVKFNVEGKYQIFSICNVTILKTNYIFCSARHPTALSRPVSQHVRGWIR